MLISLFNLPHSLMVRYSSVIAALVLALWLALFAHRYRKATSATLPISAWLHLALAVVLALVGNASGYLPEPQVGLYALALSYVLAEAVDTFLHSTSILLRQNKNAPSGDEATKQDV